MINEINFIIEIDKAKEIFRKNININSRRNENDAEHSWHLALMAIVLGKYAKPETDINKVIKLVLIHDLVEIYAGDVYCYDEKNNIGKFERENISADKLFSILDKEDGQKMKELWLEFEKCETKEAEFANVLDRLQPFILHTATEGIVWKENAISKGQVLKRLNIALNYSEEIRDFILQKIDVHIKNNSLLP